MGRDIAQSVCKQYNANLVSIHSMEEQWLLYYIMLESTNPSVTWMLTGGYRVKITEQEWRWLDGSTFDYIPTWSTWPYGQQPNFEPYIALAYDLKHFLHVMNSLL